MAGHWPGISCHWSVALPGAAPGRASPEMAAAFHAACLCDSGGGPGRTQRLCYAQGSSRAGHVFDSSRSAVIGRLDTGCVCERDCAVRIGQTATAGIGLKEYIPMWHSRVSLEDLFPLPSRFPKHLSDKPCEFNRSTQHLLAVYWQGSGTLKFFAVVD